MQPPFSRTVFTLVCEQADKAPHHPAVLTATERLSYEDLAIRAQALAAGLSEHGVGRGDRIGMLANNRVAWLEVFLGAAALGAVIVPFSTWSTTSELEFLLNDSGVRWLFMLERYGDQHFADGIAALRDGGRLTHLEHVVLLDGEPRPGFAVYAPFRETAPPSDLLSSTGADASDPLVILYTSGSSNRPKAVPLLHGATIGNAFNIGERQGLVADDRVLVSVPLFWSYGAINALPAVLSHGATLVLQGHFEAGGALDLIETHACTALYTLPAMTNALVAHPAFRRERTRSLRTGVTIGAPQDIIKAAEELGAARICNIYGGTENYGNCCVTPHHWPLDKRARCQGPPLPGVDVRIRDAQSGREATVGSVGQIEVKGYLTPGYAGASAAFNGETFTGDGYFRTGDLGALDSDGALRFAGRSSEMIKRAGINVSPAEVEEVLQQHPAVALAGVTGLADAARGELIVAYVTAKPGHEADRAHILDHCRAALSRYKVPDGLIVTEALPLTVTGKLMRRELRAMAESNAGSGNAGPVGKITTTRQPNE